MIKVYCQRKGKENASEQTIRKVFLEMIYGGELYRDDCNKVSFILNSYQDYLNSIKEKMSNKKAFACAKTFNKDLKHHQLDQSEQMLCRYHL